MSVATFSSLNDWIAREAISFSLDKSDQFDAAVDRMMTAIGDSVELLGLGEALHGGEEILVLRNRLFQRLVEKHGFSAIAIESSFPRGRLVNEFIAGGSQSGQSYDAVRESGFSHNFGKLDTTRELVEWMRQYNAAAGERMKLQFYGFDSPTEMMFSDSPRQLLNFVLDYLRAVGASAVDQLRDKIQTLIGNDADWENPAANMDPTKSVGRSANATALRIETEDLISALQAQRPEFIAKSSREQFFEAMRSATLARQLLNYHAGVARPSETRIADLLGQRDAMMADNLSYMVRRERKRGRVLAFAHNSHLKRGQAEWQWGPNLLLWWPAGAQASAMLGEKYAVIGAAVGTSEGNGIGTPEAGTIEQRLTASSAKSCFIPTHLGRGLPSAEIAALPTRTGSARNPGYFPLTPKSFTQFDWFVALDSVTYNRGGPPLPG
jgi:erythromycin esterase